MAPSTAAEALEAPTVTLLGTAGTPGRGWRWGEALHAAELDLVLGERWRHVTVEGAGLRPGDVSGGESLYDQLTVNAGAHRQMDAIADPQGPVGLRTHPVDLHLPTVAELLGLGARPGQTGDVEPDVETDTVTHRFIVGECTATTVCRMAVCCSRSVSAWSCW
jgi:hypothetical protein